MPRKAPKTPATARLNVIVAADMAADIDEARAGLKRLGVSVSISSLVEIAVTELLKRRDLAAIMRRYGATARRRKES
jgi:hypothetical protein